MVVTAFNDVPDGRRHWRRRLDQSVQNMDDSIVSCVVWSSHLRIVDEHAHVGGDGGRSLVQHGHHLSVGQVSAHDRTAGNVVQEDVCQVRQRQEASDVRSVSCGCGFESSIGRSKQGQNCGIVQCTIQTLLQQCCFEVGVVVTAFNDVPDCGCYRGWIDSDGAHHSRGRMAINAAVVVVSSWGIKGERANADWLVRGHDSIERKVNRISEGVLGDSIGNAIHVVISSHVEEGNAFALLNGQH